MEQQIPWELARDLSRQQTRGQQQQQRGPMSPAEKSLRRQSNLEALAAGSLASVIESHPKFTAEQCVSFAFEVAELVVKKAESAREKIKADLQVSE